jgi:hypothetical protein
MASGDLPADGELRLGPVRLPAGRRIVPWEGPGQPAAWVTRDPVRQPGPVWSALSGLHAETGLVPVLLADEDPDDDFGFALPCDPAEIDRVDPVQILAPRWDYWMADEAEAARGPHGPWPTPRTTRFPGLEPRPDGGPELADIIKVIMNVASDPAASAELSRVSELDRQNAGWPLTPDATAAADDEAPAVPARPFPGLAPSPDSRLTSAERDSALGALPAARIGLVPAARPADVLAVVGWIAFDDPAYPDEIRNAVWIGAVLRSWEERFGARLLTIGPGAEIKLLVDRPPRTPEAAEQIAAEHCVFCDEGAGQGRGSIPEVAAAILNAPIWTFWWD